MAQGPTVAVPLSLALRRARYQLVPIGTMVVSAALAGWLWMRHTHTATASGEVAAVRVSVESKVAGLLEELPQPVNLFDTVRKGQLVARVDLSLIEKQLERLRVGAATQPGGDAMIAELQAQLDARAMKAPIDGTVVEVHRRPGQSVRRGKPIMTIAGEAAPFIIGYLREDAPLRAEPGMKVTVRTRGGSRRGQAFETYVNSVAPQVQKIPRRHLHNPNVEEWGFLVQIALPAGMPADAALRPGEMVELVFYPKSD